MREIPESCLALCKKYEAGGDFRTGGNTKLLTAYLCPAGVPTIGYGHTATVTPEHVGKKRISVDTAEVLLLEDLHDATRIVERTVTVSLTDGQFAALVSFVFNVGPGAKGVKDGFVQLKNGQPSTMLRKLNAGDSAGAAAEFPKWTKGGGKVLSGLVKRRSEEMALFLGDSEDAGMPQSVECASPTMKPLSQSITVRSGAVGLSGAVAVLSTIKPALDQATEAVGTLRDLRAALPQDPLVWAVAAVILATAIAMMLWRRYQDSRKAGG
jgi:GH24 family phage-related lysozyme (muramidase)